MNLQSGIYQVKTIYGRQKHIIETEVPGSKSITNRALLLAALAEGTSCLHGVLFSDDSRHLVQCLKDLGFHVEVYKEKRIITVEGCGGRIPKKSADIYVGSAGTAARFLTAALAFSEGEYTLDASEQMRRRPMAPLLASLQAMGAQVRYLGQDGHFPFVLKGICATESKSIRNPYETTVNIDDSSQFLSALLIAGVMLPEGLAVHIAGSRKARSYVDITIKMMGQFGVTAVRADGDRYMVPGHNGSSEGTGVLSGYKACKYRVEPDMSAACYFFAMAAVLGSKVLVKNVYRNSMQGDSKFLDILGQLGCKIEYAPEGIAVSGPLDGKYEGITVDMQDFSDQTMTMAAIAVFASSPTTITGIGHIRLQESDRIKAVTTELKGLGIDCREGTDNLTVYPGPVHPGLVKTYEDHRMAMAFSLIGLRSEGITIADPGCTAKTFENYFELLDRITQEIDNPAI